MGVEPDGYLGHSLGENGVAYADGCFDVREACLGGYARGYVSKKQKLKPGLMVSVGKLNLGIRLLLLFITKPTSIVLMVSNQVVNQELQCVLCYIL